MLLIVHSFGQINVEYRGLGAFPLSLPKTIDNCNETNQLGNLLLTDLYKSGYLSARVDSILCTDSTATLYIFAGDLLKWVRLKPGNIPEYDINEIDISNRLFLDRPFNKKNLAALFKNIIQYYENKGYPFVSIELDSVVQKNNNKLQASLLLKKNQYYNIDSIEINGGGIEKAYLLRHLGIKEGEPYNESKISDIDTRIKELPFIQMSHPYEVQFFDNYVKIVLFVEKKKASRFDGVLGLLTNEEDGSIELTGDVDLNLINSFNRGENLGFNWRKLKGNSQDLNLDFGMPYFLNSAYGIDFNFKLFKRDTTFLDLNVRFGINYNIRRAEYLRLFIENRSSNLLSRESLIANSSSTIPFLGDVRSNLFGLGYELNRLNYKFNPSSGFRLFGDIAVGRKRLLKINALEEENPQIYEGIKLNTTQYNARSRLEKFFKIKNRSTILIANKTAVTYSENLYFNELLRIGGLKTLRGVDEESISASFYSISTLEYRFLLDQNSFFSLFTDAAFYEADYQENYLRDTPIGIGTGVSFETGSGIFTINYAIGKQFDEPFDLRIAKVHFGFINFF